MNFNKKTKIFILISAASLSLSLFFYRVVSINTQNMSVNIVHLNREISNEGNNEREVAKYIKYIKRLGGKTGGVREEPVALTATFTSYKDLDKMGGIIYNTYHKGGRFFLSSFSLTRNSKDINKNNKGVTMTIKGKKAVLFW